MFSARAPPNLALLPPFECADVRVYGNRVQDLCYGRPVVRALLMISLLSACNDDCMDALRARARPSEAVAWPTWEQAVPSPHLVLVRGELLWDEATDAYDEAVRTARCPDPLPALPRVVARIEGDELQRDGLYSLFAQLPGLRIEPDVPFSDVRLVLSAFRDAGLRAVTLRQIRCHGTTCAPEQLRVGLALDDHLDRAELIDIAPDLGLPGRVPRSTRRTELILDLDGLPEEQVFLALTVSETATGWAIAVSGGRVAPGCELTTRERIDTVSRESGLDGLSACMSRIKRDFPEETMVAFVPRAETPWRDVAMQIARLRFEGDEELFPAIVFPAAEWTERP